MRIIIEVSPKELEEMKMTVEDLKYHVIHDLDHMRDYSGYNVDVVCIDQESSKMTLSKVVDLVREYSQM